MAAGRFAPSPTSTLHVGNLRTALVAWLLARATGRRFLLRVEDLDVARVAAAPAVARGQLADLAALGLDHDGEVVRQSDRTDLYAVAASVLPTYECYCTRREIAEAASAPHDDGYRPYPGTCRGLSDAERAERRRDRPPALRVAAGAASTTVLDRWAGEVTGIVDDFVIRRNDGAWAYNLAVVVDDLAQGVDQVCRGDDLLTSAPRQSWLAGRLSDASLRSAGFDELSRRDGGLDELSRRDGGLDEPSRRDGGLDEPSRRLGFGRPTFDYAHVGLVTNAAGHRLAKRDGAVTLADLAGDGVGADTVLALLGSSLGLCAPSERITPAVLLRRFDPDVRPGPWVWPGA